MALRVVTVKPSGGDYTSLQAAFTGEVGDLTAAGLNRQLEIDCYNFVDDFAATGAGWTTDATHTVLTTAVDNHHGIFGGIGGTGAYSNASNIWYGISYATLRGISGFLLNHTFGTTATNVVFDRCIAQPLLNGDNCFGLYADNSVTVNCLGLMPVSGSHQAFGGTALGKTCYVYNCTAVGFGGGFDAVGTLVAKNCLAALTVGVGFPNDVFSYAGSITCASYDANVPTSGSGHRASQTFTFFNAGAGDYRLKWTDTGAKGYGTDLSADPTYPFAIDITGAARTAPWDIGAFVAMAAPVTDVYLRGVPSDTNPNDVRLYPFSPDSSGPVTVTPDLGALALIGFAPTVVAPNNVTAAPDVGAVTATGFAPAVVLGTVAHADVGALTATGFAPTVAVSNNQFISAGVGALVMAGFAAAVVLGTVVYPDAGSITVAGFAPTVVIGTRAYPDAGVLTLDGQTPTVTISNHQSVAPGVGALAAAGFAPTVAVSDNQSAAPGAGVLTVAGAAPSIVLGTVVYPDVGALTAAGFAPTVAISNNQSIALDVGALTAAGLAPSVSVGTVAYPGVGALTLTGLAPTVTATANVAVLPDTGALLATGFAPTVSVSNNQRIATDTGTLIASGFAPSVVIGIAVYPGTGLLTLTGFAPSVTAVADTTVLTGVGGLVANGFAPTAVATAHQTAAPGAGLLVVDGFAPSVSVSASQFAQPGDGALTVSGFAPTVVTTEDQFASPTTGILTVAGLAPAIAVSDHRLVATSTGDLTINGLAPAVVLGTVVEPDVATLALDGFAPSVVATENVFALPGAGSLVIAGFAPTINAPIAIEIGVGHLTISGLAPTINGAVAGPRPTIATLTPHIATVTLDRHIASAALETFARGVTLDRPIATVTLDPHIATATLTTVSATVVITDASASSPGVGNGSGGGTVIGTGALIITGFAPAVVATGPQTAAPGLGTLVVTGFAPAVVATGPQTVAPGLGQLTITGRAPVVSGDGGDPTHPNEPGGMTILSPLLRGDVQPPTTDEFVEDSANDIGWIRQNTVNVVTDGASQALEIPFPSGMIGGGSPGQAYTRGPGSTYNPQNWPLNPRVLYQSYEYKVSSGFPANLVGNKMVYSNIGGSNRAYTVFGGGADYHLDGSGNVVFEPGASTQYNTALFVGVDIQDVIRVDGTFASSFNLGQNAIGADPLEWLCLVRDQWHRIETLYTANTAGNLDGGVKLWLDEELILDFTDRIQWATTADNWDWTTWLPVYGGGGSMPSDGIGGFHRLRNFYTSGKT